MPVYKINETCAVPCTARELINSQDPLERRIPENTRDDKGFLHCGACGKPFRTMLKRCPECGNYFKGPGPYKPRRFEIECENCE